MTLSCFEHTASLLRFGSRKPLHSVERQKRDVTYRSTVQTIFEYATGYAVNAKRKVTAALLHANLDLVLAERLRRAC